MFCDELWILIIIIIYLIERERERERENVRAWYSGYRRGNWSQRPEFKPWTRQFAFHFPLMPLKKKEWTNLFFPSSGRIVDQTALFSNGRATSWQGGKTPNHLNSTEKLTLCHILLVVGGLEKRTHTNVHAYIYIYIYMCVCVCVCVYIYK